MKQKNLTTKEIKIFKKLLEKLPSLPNIPQELFVPIMSKNVPAFVDLAIIRNRKVLLTYRKDRYYIGWHFPGGLIRPGETFERTASRILLREVGLRQGKIEMINAFNTPRDKRFHWLSVFFICRFAVGEPIDGEWFSKCPHDIISAHRKLWSTIKPYLNKI